MASIKKYKVKTAKNGYLWRVQYRDSSGVSRTKSGFPTKEKASLWASNNTVEIALDDWVDPKLKKITVAELGEQWLKTRTHLKPSTLLGVTSDWETHVKPKWGTVKALSIRPSQVQAWVSSMEVGPSKTRAAHACLAQVLDIEVKDGILKGNPARGVTLPRKGKPVKVYLTVEDLADFIAQSTKHQELLWLLGTSGLRWGEATALRPMDLDPLRNRIHVSRAVMRVGSKVEISETKTYETRTVAVARNVMAMLVGLCAGKERDALLWAREDDTPLRQPGHGSFFDAAVKRMQTKRLQEIEQAGKERREPPAPFPRITPHGLRHVAAGLLVQSGANVKAVQRQLGHASASITLDTYAELFDDGLDTIAQALDDMLGVVETKQVS